MMATNEKGDLEGVDVAMVISSGEDNDTSLANLRPPSDDEEEHMSYDLSDLADDSDIDLLEGHETDGGIIDSDSDIESVSSEHISEVGGMKALPKKDLSSATKPFIPQAVEESVTDSSSTLNVSESTSISVENSASALPDDATSQPPEDTPVVPKETASDKPRDVIAQPLESTTTEALKSQGVDIVWETISAVAAGAGVIRSSEEVMEGYKKRKEELAAARAKAAAERDEKRAAIREEKKKMKKKKPKEGTGGKKEGKEGEKAEGKEEDSKGGEEKADVTGTKEQEGKTDGEKPAKKKRVRKKKEQTGEDTKDGESPPKKKRKRKKKNPDEDGEDADDEEESKKVQKKQYERRNIRKIMRDDQLEAETLEAQREEEERRKRVLEVQQQRYKEMKEQKALEKELQEQLYGQPDMPEEEPIQVEPPEEVQPEGEAKAEESSDSQSNSELRMLLEKPEDTEEATEEKPKAEDKENEVIELSSDDEEIEMMPPPPMDDDDDDDDDDEDPNNSGLHVNDSMNQPDWQGKVLVNVGHPPSDPDLYLAGQMAKAVKPHQIGGIRFLYDNMIESLDRYQTNHGFGCILAHSMGLGKTIQLIAFIDVVLRYTPMKTVLCIVPINTLQNWIAEFNMWLPAAPKDKGVSSNSKAASNKQKAEPSKDKAESLKENMDLSNSAFMDTSSSAVADLSSATVMDSASNSVVDSSSNCGPDLSKERTQPPASNEQNGGVSRDGILENGETMDTNNQQEEENDPFATIYRQFSVFCVSESHKTMAARAKVVNQWTKEGGVLLMGYEMYRLLCSRRVAPQKSRRSKKSNEPVVIDIDEEDRNKELLADMHGALMRPGPDMIICDEGHRIKNSHAGISQALKNIRTKRRVVLTGYPLQNNLLEYWCMVDFVRPNYLGNKTEFCNMFERPITNGQCVDSTPEDHRLMKFRAHVLHSLLEGFVQRRGHAVLKAALPPKQEYVILVRMSKIQRRLYSYFMQTMADNRLLLWANNNPLKAFAVCCKIWNHPDVLNNMLRDQKNKAVADDDLDIDEGEGSNKGQKKSKGMSKSASSMSLSSVTSSVSSAPGSPKIGTEDSLPQMEKRDQMITYDWAQDIMQDYTPDLLENGGKILLMMSIIEESLALGDKLLIFSQSLFTLDLVERFLSKMVIPVPGEVECWAKNKSYFRLDGSTSSTEREKLINQFNSPDNSKVHLFLLSTRAGCLGINLVGANRVIVLDASWNPCHDCQAVCRVYRYGQQKPCFVYRLVSDNTMEKKIYDRQINKQGMSDRVVDELQPQNQFSRRQVDNLLHYEDIDVPPLNSDDFDKSQFTDPVLKTVIEKNREWVTKNPFTHESLLLDRKDQKLTKAEKRLAKQGYEQEKKLNISYTRPSYAAFYPKDGPRPYPGFPMGISPRCMSMPNPKRQVATVRPMMSTPMPMRPGQPPVQQRAGVTVQQIQTTTDITIPGTNSSSTAGRIPAGENVLVIKTPKGVYIRTKEGKIFAVRTGPSAPQGTGVSGASSSTTTSTATASGSSGLQNRSSSFPQVIKTNSSTPKLSTIIRPTSTTGRPPPYPNLPASIPRPRINPMVIKSSSLSKVNTAASQGSSKLISQSETKRSKPGVKVFRTAADLLNDSRERSSPEQSSDEAADLTDKDDSAKEDPAQSTENKELSQPQSKEVPILLSENTEMPMDTTPTVPPVPIAPSAPKETVVVPPVQSPVKPMSKLESFGSGLSLSDMLDIGSESNSPMPGGLPGLSEEKTRPKPSFHISDSESEDETADGLSATINQLADKTTPDKNSSDKSDMSFKELLDSISTPPPLLDDESITGKSQSTISDKIGMDSQSRAPATNPVAPFSVDNIHLSTPNPFSSSDNTSGGSMNSLNSMSSFSNQNHENPLAQLASIANSNPQMGTGSSMNSMSNPMNSMTNPGNSMHNMNNPMNNPWAPLFGGAPNPTSQGNIPNIPPYPPPMYSYFPPPYPYMNPSGAHSQSMPNMHPNMPPAPWGYPPMYMPPPYGMPHGMPQGAGPAQRQNSSQDMTHQLP